MKSKIKLNGRYRNSCVYRYEPFILSINSMCFLLVDVYFNDQRKGNWGNPTSPIVPHLENLEKSIANALSAVREVGIPVIYAMNSAPRIGLQRSAFGEHFSRCWSEDGSPQTFNREFAEGGVDHREYHAGPNTPLRIPASLEPRENDLYIRKHVYSAFFDSRLDTALRNLGVDTLICAGLWADVCMAATALDALYRNYRVFWLRDGTLAGEDPDEDPTNLPNTKHWIAWFEDVIGFTLTSEELSLACRERIDHE